VGPRRGGKREEDGDGLGVGGAAGWAMQRPLSSMGWEEAKVRTAFPALLTFSPLHPPIDH